MTEARVTLDSPVLRSRWRRDYAQPVHSRRPVRQLRPGLLQDVTVRSASPVHQAVVGVRKTQTQATPASHMSQRQLIAAPQVFSGPADSKVLVRKAVQPPKVSAKKKTGHSKLSITLVSLAAIMFCSGLYIAYLGLRADHASQVQAAKLTQVANQASKTTQPAAASAALSTVKPASDAIANYVVAPNLPRYLIIPSLGVDARVLSVGVNSQGALETPNNIYDAAWYNESGQPGQPGAMLIDGHISSWTAHGVFYGLKDLKPGDAIQIVRGDGAIFNYQVVESQTYNVANVDMTAAMTPIVPGTPGLNLISCSGDVIAGTSEFNERIIVFAKQV